MENNSQSNRDNAKSLLANGGTNYQADHIHITNQAPAERKDIQRLLDREKDINDKFEKEKERVNEEIDQEKKNITAQLEKEKQKIEKNTEESKKDLVQTLVQKLSDLSDKLHYDYYGYDEYCIQTTQEQLKELKDIVEVQEIPERIHNEILHKSDIDSDGYINIPIQDIKAKVYEYLTDYYGTWQRNYSFKNEEISSIQAQKDYELTECKSRVESKKNKLEEEKDRKLEELYRQKCDIYQRECKDKIKDYPLHHPLNNGHLDELERLRCYLDIKKEDVKNIQNTILEPFKHKKLREYQQEFKHKVDQKYPLSHEDKQLLNKLQADLFLTYEDVEAIEVPIKNQAYQKNKDQYERKFREQIEQERYPLSDEIHYELERVQDFLGLEDEDVEAIESPIINQAYRNNLQQYGTEFREKIEQGCYPLSDIIRAELRERQELLGIKEEDLEAIESPIRNQAYRNNLQQYVAEFKEKREQGNYPLSDTIRAELKRRKELLGIKEEDIEFIERLIKKIGNIDTSLIFSDEQQINYWELREFLAANEWKKADNWTRCAIVNIAGRVEEGYLDKESIQNFPSKDLFTIDQLWLIYSKNHFGLSVQKKIFDAEKQNKKAFAKKVGWKKNTAFLSSWKVYDELTFGLDAPEGHLPAWGVTSNILKVPTNVIKNIFAQDSDITKHNIFGDDFVYLFSSFGEGKLDNEQLEKVSQNIVSSPEIENIAILKNQSNQSNSEEHKMNINNFKIVTLGASGAGKTVFLASLFKELSIQKNSSFKLEVKNSSQRKLLNSIYTHIITQETWPPGTKNISELTFNCCVQTEDLNNYTACQFTYFDYAGGRLTDDDEDKDFEKLVEQADVILGLLDGRKIHACLTGDSQMLINEFLNKDLPSILKRMQTSNIPIHFVISKWDILDRNKYSLSQVKKLLMDIPEFQQLLENRSSIGSHVRLIPVSAVGLEFANLQPDGSMKKILGAQPVPFLVEVPLACVLPDRLQQQLHQIQREQKKLEEQNKKINGGKNIAIDLLLGSLNILGYGINGINGFVADNDIIEILELEELLPELKRIKYLTKAASKTNNFFLKRIQEFSEKMATKTQKTREETLKAVKDEQSALSHAVKVFKDCETELIDRFEDSKLV
ncbi:GUN4 domain-containing protein [Rivularia sp. UHCC 0363]|uniref:GUN4 domain-containing protein n=1 Tax=Rivularia sp. UHCC 0363 TaxID=3110244 RepID=UPI002B1FBEC7|nr:GUN4 domain-containing protein [Rivularia sp. UHCC 0363]MEA5592840.1 GUN4 domain-containing protein [Rivularia sp. UHCC 0363]